MGIFDDILGAVTGTWKKGEALEEKIRAEVPALASIERILNPARAVIEAREDRKAAKKAGEEGDSDDVLRVLLQQQVEDFQAQGRSVKTIEDLLAWDEARANLAEFGRQLPILQEQINLLEDLPEFTEDMTAEEYLSKASGVLSQLAIKGEESAALSPEDQAFADLQAQSMELDVSLKEQELTSVKMANQQAGMMALLNMLPSKARTSTIATIMETPTLREQLFPGLFGGGGAAPGGTAQGDVFDILTQLGGGD